MARPLIDDARGLHDLPTTGHTALVRVRAEGVDMVDVFYFFIFFGVA